MRTPPADIFVWGVHPSTTKEDIVSDLEISGIKISACDIEKKSNAEEKALDPGIWPLRVKVREFIHYSNRPKQSLMKTRSRISLVLKGQWVPLAQVPQDCNTGDFS